MSVTETLNQIEQFVFAPPPQIPESWRLELIGELINMPASVTVDV